MKRVIHKPIFIIGFPRSGTTVLFESLYVHPELGWFSQYFDKFPEYPRLSMFNNVIRFSFILTEIKKGRRLFPFIPEPSEAWNLWGKYLGEKFLYSSLNTVQPKKEEIIRTRNVISKSLLYQRKRRYIGKLTGPPRINFLRKIFPDAIFINIVRDVRAVTNSLLNVPFWNEENGYSKPWWADFSAEYHKKWEKTGKSPTALAALQWRHILELTEIESSTLSTSEFLTVRYEDFTANPEATVNLILRFCKLDFTVHISKQLKKLKVQSMNYKWKQQVSAEDKAMINELVGDVLKKYDYSF